MLDKLKNIDPNILVLIGGGTLVFIIILIYFIQEYKKSKKQVSDNNYKSKNTLQQQTQTPQTSEITKGFLENLKQNKVFLALGIGILIGVGILTIPKMYRVYKAKKEVMAVLEGQHAEGMCDNIEPIEIQKVVYHTNIKNDTGEVIKFKCIKNGKVIGIGTAQYHDDRMYEGFTITY